MLYPYQDKETLCVTLEAPGKEAISDFALRAIVVFPLFPVAFLMTLSSFVFAMLSAHVSGTPLFSPYVPLTLVTLPFMCAGFAALAVIYMKLRTGTGEGVGYGDDAKAAMDSWPIMMLFAFLLLSGGMFDRREYPFWNTFALAFAVILLWSLTFVAYIVSFKFIKKPSRLQMRLARYFMAPAFFLTAMSVHVVLSGGEWATLLVGPMCVLLILSTMLLAVELSAQAYKGREVPVWRYRASYMMGGAILLTYPMPCFFDCLPLLLK